MITRLLRFERGTGVQVVGPRRVPARKRSVAEYIDAGLVDPGSEAGARV